jgi:glutathione S-transferase
MLTLFSNGFSPFARKVAMALEYKGLKFETVDGLTHANRERLLAVNPRAEVPVLVDGDITVVNSSDILAHLDLAHPERPIYPVDLKARVAARALERLADTRVDAILLDCSIWTWAERKDPPLAGLHEAGQRDLEAIFARIERTLEGFATPLPFGHWTIAEFAFWPHLAALRPLEFELDAGRFPRLAAWFAAMRHDPVFLADAQRTTAFMKAIGSNSDFERIRLFWRGDRIEWLLARGFHDWFFEEIKAGRTLWPE